MCIQCLLCTRNYSAYTALSIYFILNTLYKMGTIVSPALQKRKPCSQVKSFAVSDTSHLPPQIHSLFFSICFLPQEVDLCGQASKWEKWAGDQREQQSMSSFIPVLHVLSHWLCSTAKCHRSSESGPVNTALSFLVPGTNSSPMSLKV